MDVPYSRKIWWELNLADHLESAQVKILADFNLVVVGAKCQTAKFISPPNFPAIRYVHADALKVST